MKRDYIETPELVLTGSHQIRRTAVDNTTVSVDKFDYLLECDTNDNVSTVDIGSPSDRKNQLLIIKDTGGNAGSNAIFVITDTVATSSIDVSAGDVTVSIDTNYGYISFYSDGTQFWTIGSYGTDPILTDGT